MQKKICSSLEETPGKGGNRQVRMACLWATEGLFANAETGKNPPQQVIGAESTGELTQKVLGLAQIFGQQFTGTCQCQLHSPCSREALAWCSASR
jgi:hypothetical protein